MAPQPRLAPPAFSLVAAVSRPPRSSPAPSRASRRPARPAPRRAPRPPATPAPEPAHGIRVNKCFKSFASRRQSDDFVAARRVAVNGDPALPGARVFPGDVVTLDGAVVDWERLNVAVDTPDFVYLKHWKDAAVVCTTDPAIPNNIVARVRGAAPAAAASGPADRIFPIGRLDEASTGVILLTSDGRLPNAVLGADKRCEKEYAVVPDKYVSDEHVAELQRGVVITTVAQRDRNVRKSLTAPTLPCAVRRGDGLQLIVSLQEGRNRQIRKMFGALGYTVRDIHRTAFMGIGLDGLDGPGHSVPLNEREMAIVKDRLGNAAS